MTAKAIQQLHDDFERDPSDAAAVPSRVLDDDYDPDELLLMSQAYAGQVSLLDTCVGGLIEFLDAGPPGDETLLLLLSSRGFPLGEHRLVGSRGETLNGELVHVPLLIRFSDVTRLFSFAHSTDRTCLVRGSEG